MIFFVIVSALTNQPGQLTGNKIISTGGLVNFRSDDFYQIHVNCIMLPVMGKSNSIE